MSKNRVVEPVIKNDEEQGVPLQVIDPIPHKDVPATQAQNVVRRSTQTPIPNRKYLQYMLLTDAGEPECYDEAYQGEDASKWGLAIKDEMKSLISNQTWELAKLPEGKKALQNKWVFRIKEEYDGYKRYKARLVVKGFQQIKGIDYSEFIFSCC